MPPSPVKVGLCGFTIGAARYYEAFPVVEVQQTFYDPPPAATLERWRHQAPATFEFTMKAWQVITHVATIRTYRRLKTPLSPAAQAEAGAFRPTATVRAAWERTRACAPSSAASSGPPVCGSCGSRAVPGRRRCCARCARSSLSPTSSIRS
jgi:hypothetical protein